jgi:hypothetical protein
VNLVDVLRDPQACTSDHIVSHHYILSKVGIGDNDGFKIRFHSRQTNKKKKKKKKKVEADS